MTLVYIYRIGSSKTCGTRPSGLQRTRPSPRPAAERLQPPTLSPVRVEVGRIDPRLERIADRRPFSIDDRVPGGVAVPSLTHHVLSERALVGEPQPLRRAPRRRVERVTLPLVAPVAELVERAAHHEVHRLGGRAPLLEPRRVVDVPHLDRAGLGAYAHEARDSHRL